MKQTKEEIAAKNKVWREKRKDEHNEITTKYMKALTRLLFLREKGKVTLLSCKDKRKLSIFSLTINGTTIKEKTDEEKRKELPFIIRQIKWLCEEDEEEEYEDEEEEDTEEVITIPKVSLIGNRLERNKRVIGGGKNGNK